MESASGRYVISYNGEIYNFLSIKKRLEEKGYSFKGGSDTEVLLAAVEEWGLKGALGELNGMFAFALWDKKDRVLHLARDRLGKKPVYYGKAGNDFVFASELKAFRTHPDFKADINRDALTVYLRHNYVPVPHSIYQGVYKLPPASFVTFSLEYGKESFPEKYWDLHKVAESGVNNQIDVSFDEALDEMDGILNRAVSERMISDVPLGAFLSGGIDSSLVTAIMQKNSDKPIKTFCIGFEESKYNEAPDAKKIAEHLGTDHTEHYVTSDEARNVIPDLPSIFDEPFADPSQIPTYHVSRLARQDVTVALSGDGGDEGFAGYSRYHLAERVGGKLYAAPYELRYVFGKMLRVLPQKGRVKKLSEMLCAENKHEFYRLLLSYWKAPATLVKGGAEPATAMNDFSRLPRTGSYINDMMYLDMMAYLPDDILVKVDRASMAVSLETRAPLLDYKVIEYAWRVPLSMKIEGGEGKWLLRSLLERYIPKPLFDRPKQGFGIPHGEWIRGPLKDWAEELLDEQRLRQEGFFNAGPIRNRWQAHKDGTLDGSYHLWSILMFQAWLEAQK